MSSHSIYIIIFIIISLLIVASYIYHKIKRAQVIRFNRIMRMRYSPYYQSISMFLHKLFPYAIESFEITCEGIVVRFLFEQNGKPQMLNFKKIQFPCSVSQLKTLHYIIEEDFPIISEPTKYSCKVTRSCACNGNTKYEYYYCITKTYRKKLDYYYSNNLSVSSIVKNIY